MSALEMNVEQAVPFLVVVVVVDVESVLIVVVDVESAHFAGCG